MSVYIAGYFLALGMMLVRDGDEDMLSAFVLALLSWFIVGIMLMAHLKK